MPKAVREALSVRAGDRVRYLIQNGEVRIMAVRPISRLFGILRHDGPASAVEVEDMERTIVEEGSDS